MMKLYIRHTNHVPMQVQIKTISRNPGPSFIQGGITDIFTQLRL